MNWVTPENMIRQNVARILGELPHNVQLLAAVKNRRPEEIAAAIAGGVATIGENYVQEAECAYRAIGKRVQWHFIGHLQRNKVKKAVGFFDMIETLDSLEMALEIDKRCAETGKIMPVLIEINSAREKSKSGVLPEGAIPLARDISAMSNIRLMGLMTMGPLTIYPEDSRPAFIETRLIKEKIERLALPGVEMRYLSMGMSATYRIAIEEGANIIRLGTAIFGARDSAGSSNPVKN